MDQEYAHWVSLDLSNVFLYHTEISYNAAISYCGQFFFRVAASAANIVSGYVDIVLPVQKIHY